MKKTILIFLLINLFATSCLTHYQRNIVFYQNFEQGKFEAAEKVLIGDKKGERSKEKLLYYLNLGVVNSMLGNYEVSNQYFEKAYIFGEDYQKNYLNEILAYFTNPLIVQYPGEDWELLLIHYYKALNFLKMGDKEKALVECRRMNIKVLSLQDKYKGTKGNNKYHKDAFAHNLMGLIYDASGDFNNAFIAYRNALNIYKEDYKKLFNFEIPEQLKKDILRTAYLMNFENEVQFYEREFNMKYSPSPKGTGNIVFFWHNGLAPIKSQWAINFAINRRGRNNVVFTNDEYNLNFPFPIEYQEDDEGNKVHPLRGLSTLRVAFPKYIERPTYFQSADLEWNEQITPLHLGENLNQIAQKTLRQRMIKELGKALLRLALKKASEKALKKEGKEGLALLLNMINTSTEQADTRSWHSVPHSIYYTRLTVPAGEHQVKFNTHASGGTQTYDFNFQVKKGSTVFHTFHSLEIDPNFRNYASRR